jgi:catechol 2,3-dioxygenase-like lactoylglutathione lyase family enzyme
MPDEKKPHHRLDFLDDGIAQVAILVPNLEKAVEDYYSLFGIGPWHFYTYKRPLVPEMTYKGEPADHAFRIALSYFGPSRIELIEILEGDTIYSDFLEEHGYGIHHLGLLVDDMETALAQAKEAGIEVIQSGKGFGPDGDGYYANLNTEGMFNAIYELIERPKRRHPPEKIYPPEEE